MYRRHGDITLKSGEVVEAGVVTGPDAEWHARVEKLLQHKGDPWNWQNTELLTQSVGLEAHFYLLHRDGAPFCHIMTAEYKGVGLFGHVWTEPADRGQAAASQLMNLQMQDFRARGGEALYLGTSFDSVAFHMYRKYGFEPVEPHSEYMSYFRESRPEFEAAYFAPGDVQLLPLDWPHWPASAPLFCGGFPGVVRCAPLKLWGRTSTEGPLLPPLRACSQQHREHLDDCRVWVMQKEDTGAVVGLAAWSNHPLWPETCCVDVYCHPHFWERAGELLSRLSPLDTQRIVAYADAECENKHRVLEADGFHQLCTLPQWLYADAQQTRRVDVMVYEKSE